MPTSTSLNQQNSAPTTSSDRKYRPIGDSYQFVEGPAGANLLSGAFRLLSGGFLSQKLFYSEFDPVDTRSALIRALKATGVNFREGPRV